MKVAFLIPNYSGQVVGSLLVYYRYAQHLALAGHDVDLFHPVLVDDKASPKEWLRAFAWAFAKSQQPRRWKQPVNWFDFPSRVRVKFRPRLERMSLDHDRIVAFSWRMLEILKDMKYKGKTFGYVVEYETWAEADPARKARMEAAYRTELPLLGSSKVVESMLCHSGAKDVQLCVHGIDWNMITSVAKETPRDPRRVGFPVRMEPVKSPDVLAKTLGLLKDRHGDNVVLWGFGGIHTPRELTEKFDEFYPNPSNQELARLYARSAVFAAPSRKEGFGMPAAEAMAGGCAVVSTDNGGIHTFGVDGENCLIVPPQSPESLAEAITTVLLDSTLRERLGRSAPASVEFLRWDLAGDRFMNALGLDRA